MQLDKTTLKDLSVFIDDGGTAEGGIFGLINNTTTQAGQEVLRRHVLGPPKNFEHLQQMQDITRFWTNNIDKWPAVISNGTLVMLEKFFETNDDSTHRPSGIALMLGPFLQKALNRNQYFFMQFSLSHLSDFLKGCRQLTQLLDIGVPALLKKELETITAELNANGLTEEMLTIGKDAPYAELAKLSYRARREMKNMTYSLIAIYARMDAWHSMAKATLSMGWVFPEIKASQPVSFEVEGLYHPLLQKAVPYSISFSNNKNLLLITGANMSGKTTFMRAIGVAALLAHLGMGVPAASMRLSFLKGIITNMQVEDNILLGESYFYAEVLRMKYIAKQVQQAETHLVLMDELFKGTNVHDAYECTKAVIDGLLQHPAHLMLLSTHLYEVAQQFSNNAGIMFSYFVTQMHENGNYNFLYEMKYGISNDRLGYRILQKEGILDMLGTKQAK